MIPARPDKYRGANFFTSTTAGIATASGVVYFPPASGARIDLISADLAYFFGAVSAAQLPANLAFVAGNSTEQRWPIWGSDYDTTGVFQGGRFAAILAAFTGPASVALELGEFDVFPPNVFVMYAQAANLLGNFALRVREFPSAEELNRWQNTPA